MSEDTAAPAENSIAAGGEAKRRKAIFSVGTVSHAVVIVAPFIANCSNTTNQKKEQSVCQMKLFSSSTFLT